MKRIYEFITKANQILLFLAILGVLAFILHLAYQESSRNYSPPHVAIAQTPEAIKRVVVDDVRWLGLVSGAHVFGIVKKEVAPDGYSESGLQLKSSAGISGSRGYDDRGQIVNVVFSGEKQKTKALLKTDGLVLSFRLWPGDSGEKFRGSLFLCVTDDTDGNRLLDRNDRNDLYVVLRDPAKADVVVKGVLTYDILSETRLLVKTREGDGFHFTEIDIETLERRDVTWK